MIALTPHFYELKVSCVEIQSAVFIASIPEVISTTRLHIFRKPILIALFPEQSIEIDRLSGDEQGNNT